MSRWTWDGDDWPYMADARVMGFWEYLFQDYNGHLMPGQFLISWVVTRVAPLDFWLPVVLVAAASAGSVWIWSRALADVAGERLVTLMPLGLLAFSPLFIRPTIWWASALQVLPLQMFMGAVVILAARFARTATRSNLLWLVLALLGGVAFWEKAVLLVIPAVAVMLYLGDSGLGRLRRQAVAGAVLLGVSLAYLATYALLTRTEEGEREMGVTFGAERSLSTLTEFFLRGFGDMLAPGMLGGPWGTLPLATNPLVRAPALVVWLSVAVVSVLVVSAVLRVARAWLPVGMTAVYVVVSWGLVLYSVRFENLQMAAINDERYHVDNFAVAVLAMAMILGSTLRRAPRRLPQRRRRQIAVGAGAAMAVSLVAANALAAARIGTHPAKPWVANVTTDVERLAPVAVLDSTAPDYVLSPVWWGDDARMSRMLTPLGSDVSFDGPAERLRIVDGDGRLRLVEVGDATHARPGDVAGCGYAIGPGERVTAALTQELFAWEWLVQVNTLAGEGGTLTVELGDSSTTFHVEKGVAQRQFGYTGAVPARATLSMSEDSGTVCVTGLVVGGASPSGGSD